MTKKRRKSQPKVDPDLTIAVSLQEASTWVNQARIALEEESGRLKHSDPERSKLYWQESKALDKVGKAFVRIHNRHSRVKMS
jgi:hypothetical protein